MSELQGGLIQMNAHMVRVDAFDPVLAIGIVGSVLFAILLTVAMCEKSKTGIWGCALLTIAFAVLIVVALRLPMKKEIHACANGPVSLEQITTVYDIIEVDGKELIMRER